eukprot:12801615-Alexandrium_andersonii.AAC.1
MAALPEDIQLFDLGLIPRPDLAKPIPLHLQSRLRLGVLEDLLLANRSGNEEVLGKRHVRRALSVT